MPTPIRMPALSPTMTEGTLARWLKKEGEGIEAGDVIAEIETDKATMEVEAVDEGKLGRILVTDGTEGVPVNSIIALILEEGEDPASLETIAANAANGDSAVRHPPTDTAPGPRPEVPAQVVPPEATPVAAAPSATPIKMAPEARPARADGRIAASPLARRMAAQTGLDLATVRGSGPHGRIVKADIDQALRLGPRPAQVREDAPPERVELTNVRRVIAERLLESKQTISTLLSGNRS